MRMPPLDLLPGLGQLGDQLIDLAGDSFGVLPGYLSSSSLAVAQFPGRLSVERLNRPG